MGLVEANGTRLGVFRAGTGPDVVMLHGLGANMAFWYPRIARHLTDRYRVTLFDLRGHGGSAMPASGYTSREMAADLEGLMDRLGIGRALLAGHSFGGCVALHFAVLRPERVAGLSLADAVVGALQPTVRLRDWAYWNDVLKEKFRAIGIEIPDEEVGTDSDLLEEFASPRWDAARERYRGKEFFLPFSGWNRGKRAAAAWQRLLRTTTARADFRRSEGLDAEAIAGLGLPVQLVYGEYSMLLPTFERLGRLLPDAERVLVPGAGHFHPVVREEAFVGALGGFLDRISGKGTVAT